MAPEYWAVIGRWGPAVCAACVAVSGRRRAAQVLKRCIVLVTQTTPKTDQTQTPLRSATKTGASPTGLVQQEVTQNQQEVTEVHCPLLRH